MKLDASEEGPIFLFDLDGTITTEEILPLIAKEFDVIEEIIHLTKETKKANIPFVETLVKRVNLIKNFLFQKLINSLRG